MLNHEEASGGDPKKGGRFGNLNEAHTVYKCASIPIQVKRECKGGILELWMRQLTWYL